MRFLHLADLHLGKSLHGMSLIESGDQNAWADGFLELARSVRPDAVLIAGDVYDRGSPSGDAVELLSKILTALASGEIPVLMTPFSAWPLPGNCWPDRNCISPVHLLKTENCVM